MSRTISTQPESVDPEDIMQAALLEEGPPPEVPGVLVFDERQERFQRRSALVLTILPLVGVVVAIWLLWGWGVTAVDLGLLLAFYAFTGLGVTVGFHRLFTHRSFEVPKPVRALLAIAGSMSIEGSIIEWVAAHRRHHAYSDAYGDPHSPHLVEEPGLRGVLRGLWHAHAGWFFTPEGTDSARWAPDLRAEPMIAAIDRAFLWLTLTTLLLPPILGFAITGTLWGAVTAFIWASLVRIFLIHHATWSINSICHFYGKQPFNTRDESRNNWPLSLLSFGESWHNNHHAFPSSARHGLLRGQIDVSWRVIRTLEQLGVARNVRRVSARMLERKWAGTPKRPARG